MELPSSFKQFDYNTISDIIIHMSYTACEGGEKLKGNAEDSLTTRIGNAELYPQLAIFDLKHDFAQERYKAFLEDDGSGTYTFKVADLKSRLPYFINNDTIKIEEFEDLKHDDGTATVGSIDALEIHETNDDLEISFTGIEEDRIWLIFKYKID